MLRNGLGHGVGASVPIFCVSGTESVDDDKLNAIAKATAATFRGSSIHFTVSSANDIGSALSDANLVIYAIPYWGVLELFGCARGDWRCWVRTVHIFKRRCELRDEPVDLLGIHTVKHSLATAKIVRGSVGIIYSTWPHLPLCASA